LHRLNKILIFLYPIFLGLPDVSLSLPQINLRVDDIVIYLLLIINIKGFHKKFYTPIKFYKILKLLLGLAFISLLLAVLMGNEPSTYEVLKGVGSLPYLIVLPFIFFHSKYRNVFLKACILGLILFLYGVYKNYSNTDLLLDSLTKSSQIKTGLSFSTLNPNAVSLIGIIFSYFLFIGYFTSRKKYFLVAGFIGLMIPFFTFSRGFSFGIIISLFLFFGLRKRYRVISIGLIIVVSLGVVQVLESNNALIKNATNINVETGEGFSNRYTLWKQGLEIIARSPLGNGFATSAFLYKKYYNGHVSHNILIHTAIELGIIGLIIYLSMIFFIIKNKFRLYRKTKNELFLLQLSLFIGIFISDMSGQELYFNKYAFIIFLISVFELPLKQENIKRIV